MDADKLCLHIRYLKDKIDILLRAHNAGLEEIAPLKSELRLFRETAIRTPYLGPQLKEYLAPTELNIAPVHLAGSKEYFRKTWWMYLPWLKLLLPAHQAKDKAIIDAELSRIRDHLYDLYRFIEVSSKSPDQL